MSRLLEWVWMRSDFRYNPKELGAHVIHLRETKAHALSHANTEASEDQQLRDQQEREARHEFDALSDLDREILRLHERVQAARVVTQWWPMSQRKAREDGGWFFVRPEEKGRKAVMTKTVLGQMPHDELAERVGLSVRQVRYRLSKMSPLMVRIAVMKGWV